jgi:hypothetical protein
MTSFTSSAPLRIRVDAPSLIFCATVNHHSVGWKTGILCPMLMWYRVLLALCGGTLLFGQHAAYEFYPEFWNWLTYTPGLSLGRYIGRDPQTVSDALHKYVWGKSELFSGAKLRADGIADPEIERREHLLRTAHTELENEFWNTYFTEGKRVQYCSEQLPRGGHQRTPTWDRFRLRNG